MPQNPLMPLNHLLAPIIGMIQIFHTIIQVLIFLDHWVLALIVHHEIAWVICIMLVAIGEAISAPWRLRLENTYNDTGDKAFVAATLAVFSLWSGILSIIAICEFVGVLVWVCVYFAAIWFDARPPRLLPLIERACLAAGFDLIIIWRTHY
ncbi:hypothetical protein TRIATDRAFT_320304 [Trichoderma atroviride IMI 206040]|uniref:Uncharacterized protein n=1 Tax=Hypocrea atroviridis (strain ATCC 20476 / IMI 206040) TaxID=452589 RepID=G9P3K7_HYPAI|nr:uncharacterized protein TRIATDRAFT_320304 [Trichoderma atroviride IMI 206040]EHK42965.1 hypothetical protein TRIATDRAFT_320304 [Trichoderma atroviride IMI 206040]